MQRVLGQLLHPIAQLRRVNVQVLRRLLIGHASILDQAHSLKLELPDKLPSLHDPPPAPSKHLTRCLRNRVQAISMILWFAVPENDQAATGVGLWIMVWNVSLFALATNRLHDPLLFVRLDGGRYVCKPNRLHSWRRCKLALRISNRRRLGEESYSESADCG